MRPGDTIEGFKIAELAGGRAVALKLLGPVAARVFA